MAQDAAKTEGAADPGVQTADLAGGAKIAWVHEPRAKSVLLRLVVRVGSLDETDEEVGAAHFVEHCGFRGTKSFENEELHEFIASLGSSFGADLNACTGLTETVWILNVPVQEGAANEDLSDSDKEALPTVQQDARNITSALRILDEWARHIRFSEADVEAERKVILEEYRMKRGSGTRIKQTYWERAMPRVGARIPIGTVKSIKALTPEALMRFYKTHYRPENFGLVVAGNLSAVGGPQGLLAEIEKGGLFGPRADSLPPVLREPHRLPARKPLPLVLDDAELQETVLTIELYEEMHAEELADEQRFLSLEVTKRVFTSVLEARLREVSARPDAHEPSARTRLSVQGNSSEDEADDEHEEEVTGGDTSKSDSDETSSGPWKSAGVATRMALNDKPTTCTSLSAQTHHVDLDAPGARREALHTLISRLMREIVRLLKYGVSVEELEFAKRKWARVFQERLKPQSSDVLVSQLSEELVQHMALDCALPEPRPAHEARFALDLLARTGMTCSDLENFAKRTLHALVVDAPVQGQNAVLVLQGPRVEEVVHESELGDFVARAIEAAQMDSLLEAWTFKPPLESFEDLGRALLGERFDPFKSLGATNPMEDLDMPLAGARTVVLSNGMRVCLKDFSKTHPGRISFQAFALGGSADLSEDEDAAFSLLGSVAESSGVGALDELSLRKVETEHRCSVRFQHHWFHRGLGGSCTSGRLELLLQMIVAWLSPRQGPLDGRAFARYRDLALQSVQAAAARTSPEARFSEATRAIMLGDEDPLLRPLSAQALERATLEGLDNLFSDAFTRDPAGEFTFVFCGDFASYDAATCGGLLEYYLGRMLPRTGRQSKRWRGPGVPRPVKLGFPEGEERVVHKIHHAGSHSAHQEESRAQLLIGFKIPFESLRSEVEQDLALKCACKVAQRKLLSVLRMDRQLVYTVAVEHSRNSLSPFGIAFVSLTCNAEVVDEVVDLVFQELEGLTFAGAAQAAGADLVHSELVEWHRKAVANNSYWLFWILDSWKRCLADIKPVCARDAVEWVDGNVFATADTARFGQQSRAALDSLDGFFKKRWFHTRGCALAMLPDPSSAL
ncbi:Mitochondrial-processing peptidase subunit beta [Hondaea fermentalgiana]|uniref:Mitochondrial-processing peptidase subunit beta n=1 Tax=Hondaea fermentalgiana TaxID=2315210 RepID=A0A2R5GBY1_9STRA|nr:Mitochondrial-processing peptidase subunit beta [Hondaea fermentalgiana]|eukprot:GBG27218.1 Mitochondrial-processing peptidase subunit beta [Hondaea fermentalgiana]